jgi:DNA (cytosine-5)-methyltransferase 1
MTAYYNENNPFAASWLRELIKAGVIAQGDVDERSIKDVKASDLKDYTQCHFFAGIGVWSYSLRNAGFPDSRRVWTGSCPCQPFSNAGEQEGFSDERHLWPDWFRLIRESKPDTIFGEQVASKDGLAWLDLVSSDLENESYTFGAVDTCAAGFGAPHKRQRVYFTADSLHKRRSGLRYTASTSASRPWGSFGTLDLQSIKDSPFLPGNGFPQPLIRSLVDGTTNRMGKIRGYGNALCAPQAQAFIETYLDVEKSHQCTVV